MKDSAQLVIVGAGIVGCSLAYHLARLGWSDVVVLDAGPLPRAGVAGAPAPGGIFALDPSRSLSRLAVQTIELFESLEGEGRPCFHPVGGLELATTEERWQDLQRRHGLARARGIGAELLSAGATKPLSPLLDASRIIGALYTPGDGIAREAQAGAALARLAEERGVTFLGETEVTAIELEGGRVAAVIARERRIRCEQVVCAAGVWGPQVARMAAVTIPLQPCQHPCATTGPLPDLADEAREVAHALVRHPDGRIHLEQDGARYSIGSFDHEPLPVEPDALPRPGNTGGAPARLPFSPEHFEPARRTLGQLYPVLGRAALADSGNLLVACTPDGFPILGPSTVARGFWAALAVPLAQAGGVGQALAQWIAAGDPGIDLAPADLARFHRHQTTRPYVRTRARDQYRRIWAIRHPHDQIETPRRLRRSPFHQRLEAMGAVFFESAGWERPQWLESNAGLLARNRPNRDPWAARNWSPVQGAEHRHVRERVALFDLTARVEIELTGSGAPSFLQRLASTDLDRPTGRIVRALMLNPHGGIEADVAIARLGPERFLLVTGAANGMRDLAWLQRHAPGDGSVQIQDVSSATCTLGLWGPRAREVLQAVTGDDVSAKAFPESEARQITIGYVPALAWRVAPLGEIGWEIQAPVECGIELWDRLWQAGEPHQIIAAGLGAFDSLRLEKGRRVWGAEIGPEINPIEAGLGDLVDLEKGEFIGREAARRIKDQSPQRLLCCLILDEPDAVVAGEAPIAHDGEVVGWVASSNYGYSVDKAIAYGFLPAAHAQPGARLEIEWAGRRLPATVAKEPLFDPQGRRLKA